MHYAVQDGVSQSLIAESMFPLGGRDTDTEGEVCRNGCGDYVARVEGCLVLMPAVVDDLEFVDTGAHP